MIDVWCTLLPDVENPLTHNAEVKFFLGAAEIMARVRVLGVTQLEPGQDGFLQLMLKDPVVALRGDRFIIRLPSPAATIGGGQVVDPHPKRRHKRFNTQRLDELEQLLVGTPEEIMLQAAQKLGPASQDALVHESGLETGPAQNAIEQLISQGDLIELKGRRSILSAGTYHLLTERLAESLTAFHQQFPLRPGMPRESLKSQLRLKNDVFDALLSRMAGESILVETGALVHMTGHEVSFTANQQDHINKLLKAFEEKPYSPPSVKQAEEIVGEEVLIALIETGQLIRLGEEVLFTTEVFQEMRNAVISQIEAHGSITLAELRDQFDTSRKYAVAVLEHLDQTGVTVRKGDARQLRRRG
jgi:selenocysteine-specific elongation factor